MKSALLALVVLCITVSYATARPSVDGCYNKPADIVFILDSSASIWLSNFTKQISFVQNVTKAFDVGPGPLQTRIGIVTFGLHVWPQFNLKDKMNKKQLQDAIGDIKHKYGRRTSTGDAINYAVQHMFHPVNGSRPGVTPIAIVITDGRSQEVLKTNAAADAAHKAGIKMFAIGVGKRLDKTELRRIASDPDQEHFFMVHDYETLLTMSAQFVERTCEVTAAPTVPSTTTEIPKIQDPTCDGKPADIIFTVDGSSSITEKNFNKELDFIEKVVKQFDIGEDKTRVGLLLFSNEAELLIGLDNGLTKAKLLKEIIEVKQQFGGTNTAEALRKTRQEGFAAGVARKNVPNIAIVLTDGLSADEEATADEAKLAHMAGITVFAIGIGQGVDKVEIETIASDPDEQFVLEVDDFNYLDTLTDFMANKACAVQPSNIKQNTTLPACDVNSNTDLMFIYDASSMGTANAEAISHFVAKVVGQLDISGGYLHVGRTTENCQNGANFALSSKLSAMDFSNIRLSTYATMIKKVRRGGYASEAGGRDKAANVGVLFIDSVSGNLDDNALREAKALANVAELFVVSIGESQTLDKFTSGFSRRNVLSVKSFGDLDRYVDVLLTKFCYHLQVLDYEIDYVQPV